MRILAFCILWPGLALSCALSVVPWNQAIDFEAMEAYLAASTPRRILSMGDYLQSVGKEMTGESESYYVEFSDTVSAIFKPEDEPWDSYGEVGAYQYSKRVKLPYVPPTILRKLSWRPLWSGERMGSLQYFIKTSRDTSQLTTKMIRQRVGELVWGRLVSIAYPLGQWDFYGGNLVIDDTDTPALIDNAAIMDLIFFRYGDFPFIYKGSLTKSLPSRLSSRIHEFPFDDANHLVNPTLPTIRTSFRGFVGDAAMNRWHRRIDGFPNRTLTYVIWENTLWLHWKKQGLVSLTVDQCEAEVLARVKEQSPDQLRTFMPQAFTEAHFALIEDRTLQLISACRSL